VFQYIVRRLLWAVVLFFAITMVSYIVFFVIPTEPQRIGLGRSSQRTDIGEAIGVHGPVYREYAQFTWHVAHGSLGRSWFNRREVREMIFAAAPVSLSLVVGGAILWMLLAVPIGILSALRPRSLLDRIATVLVVIGISAHPVWLGLVFSYFLGYKLQLFPLGGYCDLVSPSTRCGGPLQWMWHLILPWVTFAVLYAALYTRMIRASVIETMDEDYVRTAEAKGAPLRRILRGHVLRNAMLPVVTMLGMDLGYWIGNAVFVESIYGLPGVGRMLVRGLTQRDLPVVMGVIVFVSVVIVLLNLIIDLLYAAIDPRVRIERTESEGEPLAAHRREQPVVSSAEQPAASV
jgi:peptide/nickel transport system permease protein